VDAPVVEVKLVSGTASASFQPFDQGIVIGGANGSAALPPIYGGLSDGSFTVQASWSGATATLRGAAVGSLTGILPPQNPAGNMAASYEHCIGAVNTSSACELSFTEQINEGRAAERIGPLILPSNWGSLSIPQQLFVLTDLERSARGLPTITGLSENLDAAAQQGANNNSDPTEPPGIGLPAGFTSTPFALIHTSGRADSSIWAGGPNDLAAMFSWVYDDGLNPNGTSWNLDCLPSDSGGCWGHRDSILHDNELEVCGFSCAMGAAFASNSDGGSYAEIFVPGQEPPLPLSFTWSQELPSLPTCEQAGDTCSWSGIPKLPKPSPITIAARARPIKSRIAILRVSLSGIRKGRPRLSFALRASPKAPVIKMVTIMAPPEVSFSRSPEKSERIVVESGDKKLKFTARADRHELTIILESSSPALQITVASPTITISGSLIKKVEEQRRPRALLMLITATNTNHVSVPFAVKLRPR
jgi:hypothetical protein